MGVKCGIQLGGCLILVHFTATPGWGRKQGVESWPLSVPATTLVCVPKGSKCWNELIDSARPLSCTTYLVQEPTEPAQLVPYAFQCRCTKAYVRHCSAIFLQVESDATVVIWQHVHT